MARYDIVGEKQCECGCGSTIQLKGWHYEKYGKIPRYLRGHNPATRFKQGNKVGWKGGEIRQSGYVLVYQPHHPAANAMGRGYVRRARLVIEKHIGRSLEAIEVVHHINEIRDDDRIENLMVCTNSEHLSMHHKKSVTTQIRDELGRFTKGGGVYGISA